MGAGKPSGPARDERGERHRDLQGDRAPSRLRGGVSSHRPPGDTCARPHAHGDREPRHDRRLAPVLDGARPLPRPQRLALEPQPSAREPASGGDRLSDRERHRGRGRVSRLAHARGGDARAGARGLPLGPRRLLHLRGRNSRRLRGLARSDRVQARGARRDRRVGGNGLGVARDLGAAGIGRRADVEPEPGVVYVWEKELV